MAEVVLRDIRKVYPGGYEAVKGVNLDIRDGEFVVLVGPSGCGKSTTLRMVAGLEEVSAGTISIGGRVVNEVHPKDRDIAMVFQNYALYPHMTVYENIAFSLKLRKVPKDEIRRRVEHAASTLGLTELLPRKPKALSGGQRQRVAVGRAIVREPKAFLFDEPLSNLDARLRVTTRSELKTLQHRLKTTTIYVTHDQEEAMTLGDRIVIMYAGIIQQAGTPLEVYRRPANRFVAGFVGTPPMNFFEGLLARDSAGLWFEEGSADPEGRPYRLRIADGMTARLASHVGRPIVLGVRPQSLAEPAPGAPAAPNHLRLRIKLIEPLGDSMDVMCLTPKHEHVVARVPAREGLAAGQVATFAVDMDSVSLFEPGEVGRNLLLD